MSIEYKKQKVRKMHDCVNYNKYSSYVFTYVFTIERNNFNLTELYAHHVNLTKFNQEKILRKCDERGGGGVKTKAKKTFLPSMDTLQRNSSYIFLFLIVLPWKRKIKK